MNVACRAAGDAVLRWANLLAGMGGRRAYEVLAEEEAESVDGREGSVGAAAAAAAAAASTRGNAGESSQKSPQLGFASMASCVVALTNTILGSGMLGLPAAFAACGYVLGTFFLFAGAIASGFGLHLLACSADTLWRQERAEGKARSPKTFYSVARYGLPRWAFLIDVAVAIKCFGVGCSYLIVIGDLMPEAMEDLVPTVPVLHARTFWVLTGWVVVGPLSCMPTLDKLKVTNNLAILCVLLVTALTVVFALATLGLISPGGGDDEGGGGGGGDGGSTNWLDPCNLPRTLPCPPTPPPGPEIPCGEPCVGERLALRMDVGTVRTLTVFIFAYTCQQNLLGVVNELRDFSVDRADTVIRSSIGISAAVFTLVSFAGYTTYGAAGAINSQHPSIPAPAVAGQPVACQLARRSMEYHLCAPSVTARVRCVAVRCAVWRTRGGRRHITTRYIYIRRGWRGLRYPGVVPAVHAAVAGAGADLAAHRLFVPAAVPALARLRHHALDQRPGCLLRRRGPAWRAAVAEHTAGRRHPAAAGRGRGHRADGGRGGGSQGGGGGGARAGDGALRCTAALRGADVDVSAGHSHRRPDAA